MVLGSSPECGEGRVGVQPSLSAPAYQNMKGAEKKEGTWVKDFLHVLIQVIRARLLSGFYELACSVSVLICQLSPVTGTVTTTLLNAPENVLNSVMQIKNWGWVYLHHDKSRAVDSNSTPKPITFKNHLQAEPLAGAGIPHGFLLARLLRKPSTGGVTYFCTSSGRCSSPYSKYTMQNTCYKMNSLPSCGCEVSQATVAFSRKRIDWDLDESFPVALGLLPLFHCSLSSGAARVKRIRLAALPTFCCLALESSVRMGPICRLTQTHLAWLK